MTKPKKVVGTKPSELLGRALDLFGPKGEFWVKGEEVETIEEGFLCGSNHYDIDDGLSLIKDMLENALSESHDEKTFDEALKRIKKLFKPIPEQENFCSIGTIKRINTPNEDRAAQWLCKAIEPIYDMSLDYDHPHIITNYNDSSKIKWPHIKAKFQLAIRLAKAAGE